MTTSISPTREIAAFAAALSYDDLPAGVVRLVKQLVLDTLGSSLAGTTLGEGCAAVARTMIALGGPPESTLLGSPNKLPAPSAAFFNGALSNALNYSAAGADVGHTGVVALAAPLALAEARRPISGRRFITAVAIAAEVLTRMSLASAAVQQLGDERLLLSGQFFGYIAAAAGGGSIAGLDASRMHSAFGLALMQVSGTRAVIVQGDPPAKAIFGAFPNSGAVLSVLLAERGLGAEIAALEGRAGFFALTGGDGDEAVLTGDLGRRFRLLETTFKPWPVSGVIAPYVEAAIALASAHDLRAQDIARVDVIGPPAIRQWCEPVAERRRPSNGASASNSTLYATAKALTRRRFVLADVAPAGLRDALTLRVAERTHFRPDGNAPAGIAVELTGGGRLFITAQRGLGGPERPLSDEQLRAKFRDCCAATEAVSAADAERLIAFIDRLEEAGDVAPLADLAALRACERLGRTLR